MFTFQSLLIKLSLFCLQVPENLWWHGSVFIFPSCIPNKSTSQRVFSKNDKTVTDEFNQFLVSVGQSTVDNITSLANECNLTLNQNYFAPRQYALTDQFTRSTIDYKQIERIITAMPSNKAPGIDKIPIRVIKDCLNPIVHAITSIVNAFFLTCVFPSKWKTAEVTPIPKDGDHEQANNDRPISLLPVLSKAPFTRVRTTRIKTCSVPPCVYTGPAELDEYLNG